MNPLKKGTGLTIPKYFKLRIYNDSTFISHRINSINVSGELNLDNLSFQMYSILKCAQRNYVKIWIYQNIPPFGSLHPVTNVICRSFLLSRELLLKLVKRLSKNDLLKRPKIILN